MIFLQIESVNGYKQYPDFYLHIHDDGTVAYRGRYFVGIVGDRDCTIDMQSIDQIKLLTNFLLDRNQKNYLKKNLNPAYSVTINLRVQSHFEIDIDDVISEDIISQIIDLAGARKWINAELGLYLVMSKSGIRTRELGVLRAADLEQAKSMYLDNQKSRSYKSEDDFIAIQIGAQKPKTIVTPIIYFSFSDYNIQERAPSLFLNQGSTIESQKLGVYLFISFGKRYNAPRASYIMVLGKDKQEAANIFHRSFPHFMPNDFQQVDLEVDLIPNPLFETHIPIVIR